MEQNGKVKWFSVERGYGYITNNENKDLYFGVKDVIGSELPENGDIVSFYLYIGKENLEAAKSIRITEKKNPEFRKIICNSCGREVDPKPWVYGGSDYTNISFDLLCPFCGIKILSSGGGFNSFGKSILFIFIVSVSFLCYSFF